MEDYVSPRKKAEQDHINKVLAFDHLIDLALDGAMTTDEAIEIFVASEDLATKATN